MTLLVVPPVAGGCSSRPAQRVIAPGDRVRIEYTCTLPNGDLAATSDERTARSASVPKSALFVPGEDPLRLVLTAGPGPSAQELAQAQSFRAALSEKMAEALVGMKIGETRKVALSASVPSGLKDSERFLQMARVRKRAKEKTMTRDFFLRFSKGKGPEIGQQIPVEPGFLGTVSSLDEKTVTLRITPEDEKEIRTDFGKGTIRDKEDHYEIELDVRPGMLVRIGPLVGTVAEVQDETFTLDFGHPFGGQVLWCTIRPVALEETGDGKTEAAAQDEGRATQVEAGDVATVEYTIRLDAAQGAVGFGVSRKDRDSTGSSLAGLLDIPTSGAERVLAGQDSSVPGLSRAIVGMRAGERRTVRIPPEEAYGAHDPEKMLKFPRIRRTPRILQIPVEEFAMTFGVLPEKNQDLPWVPYFETRVASATIRDVTLENVAVDGRRFEEDHGTTVVSVRGEEIVTRLDPRIGASFEYEKRKGRIVSADEDTFTVDFNHPLAGEALEADVFVSALTKGETLRDKRIPWFEAYDQGMEAARTTGSPAVLVLYAADCPWSQKLLAETLEDPRVKTLEDLFVWIKVDSGQNGNLQAVYEQKSFPTVLLLSPAGPVLGRHEGFLTARGLLEALDRWTTGSDSSG